MDIIQLWLLNLFTEKKFCSDLVSSDFNIEDGMNLEEYWQYELESSINFSDIFHLDSSVTYELIKRFELPSGNYFNFIYVKNRNKEIAFKMNITTNDKNNLISSNEYVTQVVPKVEIVNNTPSKFKFAIKSKRKIVSVSSPDLLFMNFNEGFNFSEDGFYNVEFQYDKECENSLLKLYIKFEDKSIEKRMVYVDEFRQSDIPYSLKNNQYTLDNEKMPVNIAIFGSNNKNFVYPRNIEFNINEINKVITTDVLDNDWVFINK